MAEVGKTKCMEFGCKTFGDYHDIYLKTDVLLPANVCEKFRAQYIIMFLILRFTFHPPVCPGMLY